MSFQNRTYKIMEQKLSILHNKDFHGLNRSQVLLH